MRVLICHERFLFRYGADRVFMLIAEKLSALGWHVSMLAARFDRDHLERYADSIHTLPMPRDYIDSDKFCSRWLRESFAPKVKASGGYDLVIHGGWPLFAGTNVFRELAPIVMFLDHGVVPDFGYLPGQQAVLRRLGVLRRAHLASMTHAAGVSRFVVETQTKPDSGPNVPCRVLLNGTDHLENQNHPPSSEPSLEIARNLHSEGCPLILNLGRFETGTYKNSQAAFEIFQLVRSAVPAARLLVLEEPRHLHPPPHLAFGVHAIGFPSDAALAEIMRISAAGLSVSQWEGFNLPLVEMLRNRTPAFAFRIGAHAEVVPDAHFLCGDSAELAAKLVHTLEGPSLASARLSTPTADEHWSHLSWDRFIGEMLDFVDLPQTAAASFS